MKMKVQNLCDDPNVERERERLGEGGGGGACVCVFPDQSLCRFSLCGVCSR